MSRGVTFLSYIASQLLKRPMLVGVLVVVGAIFLYGYLPSPALALSFVCIGILLFVLYSLRTWLSLSIRQASYLLYAVALSALGALGSFLPYAAEHRLGIDRQLPRYADLELQIIGHSVVKGDRIRYDARVESGEALMHGSSVLLYVVDRSARQSVFSPGSRIRCRVRIKSTRQYLSQDSSRSFGRFLLSRQMQAVCYADSDGLKCLGADTSPDLKTHAVLLKQKLLRSIDLLPIESQDKIALGTICLGRSDMGEDERLVQQRYATIGASHLLAVSGFHLGVVAAFAMLLLYPLRLLTFGGIVSRCLTLLLIWTFAFITGLSEPTVRASLMLSFFLLAQLVGRRSDGANLLAASALCILLVNPFSLYGVGFVLSYVAVLSILLFYPLVYRLIPGIKNPLVNGLWRIFAVGLSVQMLCFPLCLYFFGSGSLLGILINVPITLLSIVLIPGGLIWMIGSHVGTMPGWFGEMLSYVAQSNGGLVSGLWSTSLPSVEYRLGVVALLFTWCGAIYGWYRWHTSGVIRQR